METLRTWQRRYGFPAPAEREGSGHRRYPLDTVERLRLASRALAAGHKPSVALRASTVALRDLLALTVTGAGVLASAGDRSPATRRAATGSTFVERCLDCIAHLDGAGFIEELDRGSRETATLEFLVSSLGPLLHALGDAWDRKEIEVGHEHFASEHLREFVSSIWRPRSERAQGGVVVCATVAGERHVLGLHLAATALALAGARIVFLGADMPPREVASAAESRRASGIALSAAPGTSPEALRRDVRILIRALRRPIPIVVGGAGFEHPPPGVIAMPDLTSLHAWAGTLGVPPV